MIKKLIILLTFCSVAYAGSLDKTTEHGPTTTFIAVGDSIRLAIDSLNQGVDSMVLKSDGIVSTAMKYLGKKYRIGHRGPHLFDCSGFTSYVYEQEGITIGRSSRDQFREGEQVELQELRKGDLVFFSQPSRRSYISHVGIVTEADTTNRKFKFIHACRRGVSIDSYPDMAYYRTRYVSARRILTTAK